MGVQGHRRLIAFDLPPPAIVIPKPAADWRLYVKDGKEWDCGPCLPRDFRDMPRMLRATVPADEIRRWLPEPYRRLSDDLLWSLVLGNVPALPSAILAGTILKAWLFTASDTLTIASDWNSDDNAQHAVGAGGNGASGVESSVLPGNWYGGAGGGGGAYAGNRNRVYVAGAVVSVSISANPSFDSAAILLADGGGNGGTVSGGSSSGGQAGLAVNSVGDLTYDGEAGTTVSGFVSGGHSGTPGGSAAGPSGSPDPASHVADNGQGGYRGDQANISLGLDGWDGVDGPGGGWNPRGNDNAGSGGGGSLGYSGPAASRAGGNGGAYGGAGGGGGAGTAGSPQIGTPGTGAQGCVLVVNNTSA